MLGDMSENTQKSSSVASNGSSSDEGHEKDYLGGEAPTLPSSLAGSGTLDRLVDTARDYACAAASDNTLKA